MKNFWKATLIPGLCCILAGLVLAVILVLGYSDELMEHAEEFSINADNYFDFIEGDKFVSATREGKHYGKSDTKESYYFAVPEGEVITALDFSFAVGEVELRTGENMEVSVTDMFEGAITSKVAGGVWYIEDSLIDSGSVHSDYSPAIIITIPEGAKFQMVKLYLAAGLLEAEELSAPEMSLEVDAGSMKVFRLTAKNSLELKNGVGEIKVYDAETANMNVDNGIGFVSIIGAVSGRNFIECGIGEVNLTLVDRKDADFNYKVSCGIGEVQIGDKVFHGASEHIGDDSASADYFDLDCGIGQIAINFNGN